MPFCVSENSTVRNAAHDLRAALDEQAAHRLGYLGNLYAVGAASNQISMITPDGLTVSTFATGFSAPAFIAAAPTPEPSTTILILAGGMAWVFKRRRTQG